jgi:DNA-binding NarL/FixJ family response regulator
MTLYDEGCAPSYTLTPRQIELLQCAAEGMSDKEIAAELSVSARTVKRHLQQIRGRLGTRNTTQAVYVACRLGLIRM